MIRKASMLSISEMDRLSVVTPFVIRNISIFLKELGVNR